MSSKNVCVPSDYNFRLLKPFYLFKQTNKGAGKVCRNPQDLKSPGRFFLDNLRKRNEIEILGVSVWHKTINSFSKFKSVRKSREGKVVKEG